MPTRVASVPTSGSKKRMRLNEISRRKEPGM
jgi:hypothetical protein